MRILPSQSTCMKRNVGSTVVSTTSSDQSVFLGDASPVRHRRAAQRIGSQRRTRIANRIEVDDRAQVVDVLRDKVVAMRVRRAQRRLDSRPAALPSCRRPGWRWRGPRIHLVAVVSAGPPLVGLYLKPPSSGGLCDGVITMPSASSLLRPRLYCQNGMRQRRSRRVAQLRVDHDLDAVGQQHFQRALKRRLAQRVRVLGEKQRAAGALRLCGIRKSPARWRECGSR